jgi:hypothetical protein
MENEYIAHNIYEAAYLLSSGYKLLGKKGQALVFPPEARGGGESIITAQWLMQRVSPQITRC